MGFEKEKNEEDWIEIFSETTIFMIAVDSSQTILNYKDYLEAKEKGKTLKTWVAYKDWKTRKTHHQVDEKTIPIDSLFIVGKTFMRFPHDWEMARNHLEELINCRCTIKYS